MAGRVRVCAERAVVIAAVTRLVAFRWPLADRLDSPDAAPRELPESMAAAVLDSTEWRVGVTTILARSMTLTQAAQSASTLPLATLASHLLIGTMQHPSQRFVFDELF